MASSVFGLPITEETLRATGEYKEPITQKDVADYAMKMMNAADKDTNAQKFVDDLKDSYGKGISTKCLIYNATGTTLTFVTSKDWHGHIYETPPPTKIQNGQWGAFLHVHPSAAAVGSSGAVVYRSTFDPTIGSGDKAIDAIPIKKSGDKVTDAIPIKSGGEVIHAVRGTTECDWLFSWSIPYTGDNTVYTEIREKDHFPEHWDYIYDPKLENSGRNSTDEGYGYRSTTSIGEGTTVNAQAIFELPK